jgi:hypothetical protein
VKNQAIRATWWQAHRDAISALGIITAGFVIRLVLIAHAWPNLNSDEATMGLMAKHILTRGEHPIFFYGQNYMGSIEAYLAAGSYLIFGYSVFALKFGMLILYAILATLLYAFMRALFAPFFAVLAVAILSLGTDFMLYLQLEATGGYMEILIFTLIILLITRRLCLTMPREGAPHLTRERAMLYAAWGFVAGVGLWSQVIIAPFVVLAGAVLALCCWREMRHWLGAILLASLIVGVSPWIVFVATDGAAHERITIPGVQVAPLPPVNHDPLLIGEQILGTVIISIPNLTGANALCPVSAPHAWPPDRWAATGAIPCMVVRGAWGVGYIALWLAAMWLLGRPLWDLRGKIWNEEERRLLANNGVVLVLLVAAGAVTIFFALSPVSVQTPWPSSRYLTSLLLLTPVIIATLWHTGAQAASARFARWATRSGQIFAVLLMPLLCLGTVATFGNLSLNQQQIATQDGLVTYLRAHGGQRFYTDYWTCLRTIFLSNEQLVCGNVTMQMQLEPGRYPPYDRLMLADPATTYVFPYPSAYPAAFQQVASAKGWHYTQATIPGYIIYQLAPSHQSNVRWHR